MTAFTGTNLPGKRENFQTKRPFLSLCLVVLVEFLGLFVLGDKFRCSLLRNLVTANKWSRLVFRILSLEAMTDDDVPKTVPWRNLTKHRPSPCLFRRPQNGQSVESLWIFSRAKLSLQCARRVASGKLNWVQPLRMWEGNSAVCLAAVAGIFCCTQPDSSILFSRKKCMCM